jgi:peptidoglycan hydrolase-like protein with peptidoglycan-binding domain
MKTWTITGALLVAGAMLAGPALAQTTPGTESKDKAKSGADTGKSDAMKSDGTKAEGGAAKAGGRMAGGNKEQVKAVQQARKEKGHDPGSVDGVMGPKTQAALKEFQDKEGIKASGRLDAETMSKLGVQAKAGASSDSSSSPSASPSGSSSGTTSGSSSSGASSSSPSSSPSSGGSTGAGSSSTPSSGTGSAAPKK